MRAIVSAITAAIMLTACYDEDGARSTLRAQGYTDIATDGYSWFDCGDRDTIATAFEATTIAGVRVNGAVCCGLFFKNCTIRTQEPMSATMFYAATVMHNADGTITITPANISTAPLNLGKSTTAQTGAPSQLTGTVKKNWPPREGSRAPHKLVVEYPGERDWRTWLIWGDTSQWPTEGHNLAAGLSEGDTVTGWASKAERIDERSGKPEISIDRLEAAAAVPEPDAGGYVSAPSPEPAPTEAPAPSGGGGYADDDIPFGPVDGGWR